ncbi:hypothetical protein [Kolteria novifilia]|uniref:hypothetical protein n=1 Tax=Kolteria novifilia TaxID=2527975 RepID=UPI003AF38ABF
MNRYFTKNWAKSQKGLLDHLKKADIVPTDFRILDAANQSLVMNFLQSQSDSLRSKALIME